MATIEISEQELRVIALPYADRVSLLMRTTHRDASQEIRFRLAFEDATFGKFDGILLHKVKQAIGSILGSRVKSKQKVPCSTSVFPAATLPSMTFVVVRADRGVVVLATPVMGERLIYRRTATGEVVNTSFTNNLRQIANRCGLLRAQELFAEMDLQAVRVGSITLGERSSDLVTMTIAGKWKMVACRGVRDVIAQVSEIASGKPTPQNVIDVSLLRDARGLANWYLRRDTKSGELFA